MNLESQSPNHVSATTLEQLSAWMDGELDTVELDTLLAAIPPFATSEVGCYASVQTYQAIGDVMRSTRQMSVTSGTFLSDLSRKIAMEAPLHAVAPINQPRAGEVDVPVVPPVVHRTSGQEAANHSVFRWKMVAGLASVAAVAMVGWNSMSLLSAPAGNPAGQQVAAAGKVVGAPTTVVAQALPPTTAQGLVQMPVTVGQNATVMLRDPRLDELLAARGPLGGTANLQMPAGFLRNATFSAEKKSGGCADQPTRLC